MSGGEGGYDGGGEQPGGEQPGGGEQPRGEEPGGDCGGEGYGGGCLEAMGGTLGEELRLSDDALSSLPRVIIWRG